jgi:tetratricopeptide (TPR) repeat protein
VRLAAAGFFLLAATTFLAHGQDGAVPPSPPNDPLIYQRRLAMVVRLATQDYEAGNYQGALDRLAALQGAAAQDLSVLNLRGAVLTKSGDYEGARKVFQGILTTDPSYFPASFNLAEVQFMAGDAAGALEAFRTIRTRDPRNELVLFKVILCHLTLGQEEEARKLSEALIPAGSTPAWYYAQAALARKAGDRRAEAKNIDAALAIYEESNCKLFDESMAHAKF